MPCNVDSSRTTRPALVDGPALKRSETPALTPDAARTLLAAVRGDRDEAAFVTLIATGMRRGELFGLCWDDVDLDAGVAMVRRQVQRHTGQGLILEPLKTDKSRRALALPAPVVTALRAHRRTQTADRLAVGPEWSTFAADHGGLVFAGPLGGPVDPNDFYRRVRPDRRDRGARPSNPPHGPPRHRVDAVRPRLTDEGSLRASRCTRRRL